MAFAREILEQFIKEHEMFCLLKYSAGHIILRGWCESLNASTYSEKVPFDQRNFRSLLRTNSKQQKNYAKRTTKKSNKIVLWFEVEDTGCGKSKIATIMIVMSLSIEYSDLKPHLNELGNAIAAGLKISPSEVHLLNFTESGNKTIMTLSIQPSESTSYFSYTTAMEIINRFSGHQFQLPASFGNYSLVDWKVEPPLERSWWNQHKTIVLGCIFGVVAVLAIGFALFGIWYVRKQRQ